MKKACAILLVGFWLLSLWGCSAQSLKKAEENTRLAGATSPLGALIYLPVWAASTVANAVSGSTPTLEEEVFDSGENSTDDEPSATHRLHKVASGSEETMMD